MVTIIATGLSHVRGKDLTDTSCYKGIRLNLLTKTLENCRVSLYAIILSLILSQFSHQYRLKFQFIQQILAARCIKQYRLRRLERNML